MSLSAIIKAMHAAGCSVDQIIAAVEADEEARLAAAVRQPATPSSSADRQARYRARKAEQDRAAYAEESVTGRNESVTNRNACNERYAVTSPDVTVPLPEVSPKDNNQTPFLPIPDEISARANDRNLAALADEFYDAYPKKVDPRDAKARFIRLAKAGVDPRSIIAAANRFAEAHRLAGTDKQFIRAPAVWLNKGGYESEDLPQARAPPRPGMNGHKSAQTNIALDILAEMRSPQSGTDDYAEDWRTP